MLSVCRCFHEIDVGKMILHKTFFMLGGFDFGLRVCGQVQREQRRQRQAQVSRVR
jgi:hypothetical protein